MIDLIENNAIYTCNKELKGINWSQYIDESALLRLPPGQTAPGFTVGRPYYLGFGNVFPLLFSFFKKHFNHIP